MPQPALQPEARAECIYTAPPWLLDDFRAHPPTCSLAAGHCAATLAFMRQHAQPFLQGLLRDNYGAFAELFTAAVLQAAVTGEAVLDEELGRLAQQDVSRFEQLNQRLQVSPSWSKGLPGPWTLF